MPGTLALRVSADGSHDALEIYGSGQLAGTLTLMPQRGLYADQTSYQPLISASGALWGSFGSVELVLTFLPGKPDLRGEQSRRGIDTDPL